MLGGTEISLAQVDGLLRMLPAVSAAVTVTTSDNRYVCLRLLVHLLVCARMRWSVLVGCVCICACVNMFLFVRECVWVVCLCIACVRAYVRGVCWFVRAYACACACVACIYYCGDESQFMFVFVIICLIWRPEPDVFALHICGADDFSFFFFSSSGKCSPC